MFGPIEAIRSSLEREDPRLGERCLAWARVPSPWREGTYGRKRKRSESECSERPVGTDVGGIQQNMQFQQETRASIQRQESSIQNLTTQMGHMATSMNTLQSQNSDKLPSQTMLNLRNVSAITLRSGKQTEVPTPRTYFLLQKEHDVDA
ncbi:hypothetical protein Lal_00039780 [Lupinus albus]|nr:hypothetical protein Lal_00039780 [Lupinus albus]